MLSGRNALTKIDIETEMDALEKSKKEWQELPKYVTEEQMKEITAIWKAYAKFSMKKY